MFLIIINIHDIKLLVYVYLFTTELKICVVNRELVSILYNIIVLRGYVYKIEITYNKIHIYVQYLMYHTIIKRFE